jgi:hypothetical protein
MLGRIAIGNRPGTPITRVVDPMLGFDLLQDGPNACLIQTSAGTAFRVVGNPTVVWNEICKARDGQDVLLDEA